MVSEEMDSSEILAELALLTSDEDVKSVLTKYQPNLEIEKIFNSLKKVNIKKLRVTLTFLNRGAPVDGTKEEICNKIIEKIENLLPETCKMCEKTYHVSYDKIPSLSCFLCNQGIHEKCFIEKTTQNNLPLITGLHWLCSFCEPRACIGSVPKTKEIPESENTDKPAEVVDKSTIAPQVIDKEKEYEIVCQQDPIKANPQESVPSTNSILARSNKPNPDKNDHEKPIENKVCYFYKRQGCKHGFNGDGCKYSHPEMCRKFTTYGDRHQRGCSRDMNCKFLHPKLCLSSKHHGECYNSQCKYFHLLNTRRIPPLLNIDTSERITPGPNRDNANFDSYAFITRNPPRPAQQAAGPNENYRKAVPQHFNSSYTHQDLHSTSIQNTQSPDPQYQNMQPKRNTQMFQSYRNNVADHRYQAVKSAHPIPHQYCQSPNTLNPTEPIYNNQRQEVLNQQSSTKIPQYCQQVAYQQMQQLQHEPSSIKNNSSFLEILQEIQHQLQIQASQIKSIMTNMQPVVPQTIPAY